MWHCDNCGARFEEPDYIEECMEDYYGVGSMFMSRTYRTMAACPNCGSVDYVEEIDESLLDDEIEDEL